MINSIELTNWKTHKHTHISFSKGTNVLIGQMGAGKSTVMDAISYSFFGTFPSLKHHKSSLSGAIKNRPTQEKEAAVKLNFTIGDDEYVIERTLQLNGASKATLSKNGSYLQSQPERVNEEVNRILKVDYDLFARAVYSEQNGLDYFLRIRAKERKEQIDELLGLDKFTMAGENANGLIYRLKDMIADQEATAVQFDINKLKAQIGEYRNEYTALLDSEAKLETDLKAANNTVELLGKQLKDLKEKSAKKTELTRQLSELRSKKAYIEQELAKIDALKLGTLGDIEKQMSEHMSKLIDLKKKERSLDDAEHKIGSGVAKLESELSQLSKKIVERDKLAKEHSSKDLQDSELKIKTTNENIQRSESEYARFASLAEESKKWLSELKKHLSKCPVCERELGKELSEKLITEREKVIADAVSGASKAKSDIAVSRKEVEELKSRVEKLKIIVIRMGEYANLDSEMKEKQSVAKVETEKLNSAKSERKGVRESIEKLQVEVESVGKKKDDLSRRDKYSKDSQEIANEVKAKETELSTIVVDDKSIESVQSSFVSTNAIVSRLTAEKSANDRYITDKKKQISDKESEIGSVERIYSEMKSNKELAEDITKFKVAIDETKLAMRSRLILSINSVLDDIWPSIYPYGDYPGIMLEATSDDYVLKVMVEREGKKEWEEVESVASGGERSTACLALRVGFALVLVPHLRWIILDEPTHNIDQEGIGRFVKVFNENLPKIIDQIFIITHDELLKHSSSAKTYVFSRDKAKGESTMVTEA